MLQLHFFLAVTSFHELLDDLFALFSALIAFIGFQIYFSRHEGVSPLSYKCFNLEAGYIPFSENARGVVNRVTKKISNSSSILLKQTGPSVQPPQWYLQDLYCCEDDSAVLAFRLDTLDMVGFANKTGHWHSFEGMEHLLPGSRGLGFRNDYDSLIGGQLTAVRVEGGFYIGSPSGPLQLRPQHLCWRGDQAVPGAAAHNYFWSTEIHPDQPADKSRVGEWTELHRSRGCTPCASVEGDFRGGEVLEGDRNMGRRACSLTARSRHRRWGRCNGPGASGIWSATLELSLQPHLFYVWQSHPVASSCVLLFLSLFAIAASLCSFFIYFFEIVTS